MKNTFGHSVTVTLFGESHGECIGAVLDGLAPGITVEREKIAQMLSKRRPASAIDTARRETDEFTIVSGCVNGKTTGTPLCILIPNQDKKSGDYEKSRGIARPSHADYAAFCKYHGHEDIRGGGHFSGRITAALVAAGSIALPMLEGLGITLGSHILRCAKISDRGFDDIANDIKLLENADFPVLTPSVGQTMQQAILSFKEQGDSVGGVVETAVLGMPSGVGEPWFDSMEGMLSHALFSVGGIKGVSFGAGFAVADMTGSECNDPIRMEQGKAVTLTNRNGGINGGITNGMPILFQCAVKPTPSIAKTQKTVNYLTGENVDLSVTGRHDPAIVRRICPVIDSVTALVLCDMLALRYGTDVFTRGIEP